MQRSKKGCQVFLGSYRRADSRHPFGRFPHDFMTLLACLLSYTVILTTFGNIKEGCRVSGCLPRLSGFSLTR
jgi:hypothetical protein